MKYLVVVISVIFLSFKAFSHDHSISPLHSLGYLPAGDTLPPVFMIGQFSDPYEKLSSNAHTLLEISQNDVYLAYDKWLDMLSELATTADHLGFNLKGAKFWCSVYWNQDGTIRHFAYFPKPGCVTIDHEVFKGLLTTFISNYKMPISVEFPYYNYGSVAFPIPVKKQIANKN